MSNSDWREMKELYGFSICDFLADMLSEVKDCMKACPSLAALLSSGPLDGVLKGEAGGFP